VDVAVIVSGLGVVESVQLPTCATPFGAVICDAAVSTPFEVPGSENVTATPATGFPLHVVDDHRRSGRRRPRGALVIARVGGDLRSRAGRDRDGGGCGAREGARCERQRPSADGARELQVRNTAAPEAWSWPSSSRRASRPGRDRGRHHRATHRHGVPGGVFELHHRLLRKATSFWTLAEGWVVSVNRAAVPAPSVIGPEVAE